MSLNVEKRRVGSVDSLVSEESTASSCGASDCTSTPAHGLLRDFEVLRFLAGVDSQLRSHRRWLDVTQRNRLSALYLQAVTDDCEEMIDIVEHIEEEHLRLIGRFTSGAPSSIQ